MNILSLCRFSSKKAEYKALLRSHLPLMHVTAVSWTHSQKAADDLLQDTLQELTHEVDTMKTIDNLGPWLLEFLYQNFMQSYYGQPPAYIPVENQPVLEAQSQAH